MPAFDSVKLLPAKIQKFGNYCLILEVLNKIGLILKDAS